MSTPASPDPQPAPDLAALAARLTALMDNPAVGDEGAVLEEAHAAFLAALTSPGGLPRNFRALAATVFARLGSYALVDQLLQRERAAPSAVSPDFLLEMARVRTDADRLDLLERHRTWGAAVQAGAAGEPVRRAKRPADGRIRLGFLSSDLRNHVVGLFALPVFKHVDPRFDLYAYSAYPGPADPVQQYIAGKARFCSLAGLSPRDAAQRMADDGLDILVELSGHTHRGLAAVVACRAAPIQVSWLGYPHSLGIATIDRLVVDPRVEPDGALMAEAPLRLPSSWVSYYRPMFQDDQAIEPGLPEERTGRLTFGTMNTPVKYTPDLLRVWAGIVAATPGSRFLFVRPEAVTPTFRRNMVQAFALEGVEEDRVMFDPLRGFHMPGYNRIDIALDTFPLTGGTTTLDALWMGVPVVSMVGPALYERLGLSLLTSVGEPGLAAASPQDYQAVATALAADPARRRTLRGELRGRILASPLGDAAAFAGEFYQAMATLGADEARSHAARAAQSAAEGRMEEALESHRRVVAVAPAHALARFHLAATLQALGRLDEAEAAYAESARLDPTSPAPQVQRAGLLLALGRPEAAVAACDAALALGPTLAPVWSNRGVALLAMNRPAEALEAFERTVALAPDFPPGHANRGGALRELNRVDEAAAALGRALALAPDYVEAECNLGVCRLLAGDLQPGFAGHEQRWRIEPGLSDRRDFAAPLWLGREDVAGKTVLLHAEQGFGDTINFCRYAPLLAARGARVVLEVQPALKMLMASLAGVSQLVARGEPLPEFDYHCPLISLPLAFGTRLDTIPAPLAYLAPPPDRAAAWAAELGPARGFRLGVVWSGKPTHHNDHNRSIPLERFLAALPTGIEVVSLHDRVRDADAAVLRAHPRIRRFDGRIADFADTATLASAMDLVISVDTSAAHLAAAIGRPTWVLLPFAPDWRWLLERDDSPWYPTVRLFRQPALGDWDRVLARVRVALLDLVG